MLHPKIYNAYNNGLEKIKKNKHVSVLTAEDSESKANFPKHVILTVTAKNFIQDKKLHDEIFGPCSLIVKCKDQNEMLQLINSMEGQLTGTILADINENFLSEKIINALELKVGRIIFNGVPTGVEVCPSMTHGGPYPASTDSRFSAVGTNSIKRWLRPVSFQDFPQNLLPNELKNDNPLMITRKINGIACKKEI